MKFDLVNKGIKMILSPNTGNVNNGELNMWI